MTEIDMLPHVYYVGRELESVDRQSIEGYRYERPPEWNQTQGVPKRLPGAGEVFHT